jgi:hypothetical protein
MKIMVNSEAIAVTLQKICTSSSPPVRVGGSVTAGKLAEFHMRYSVPKMPQPIGPPAMCPLCQSRVAQPFRGKAGPAHIPRSRLSGCSRSERKAKRARGHLFDGEAPVGSGRYAPADAEARRQSNLLPAGPPHLSDFVADLDFIPAQPPRDLVYRDATNEHLAQRVHLRIRPLSAGQRFVICLGPPRIED